MARQLEADETPSMFASAVRKVVAAPKPDRKPEAK